MSRKLARLKYKPLFLITFFYLLRGRSKVYLRASQKEQCTAGTTNQVPYDHSFSFATAIFPENLDKLLQFFMNTTRFHN